MYDRKFMVDEINFMDQYSLHPPIMAYVESFLGYAS